MIRKKFIYFLITAIIAFTTFMSVSNSFTTHNFETVKQHVNSDRRKINYQQDKYNYNKVEYEITNDNTELVTGLISFGGETDGSRIIAAKAKDLQKSKPEIKIIINLDMIDLKKSYYVSGNIGNNNNFVEKGNKIIIKTKELVINSNGVFYLHLSDNYGIDYNCYLEIGATNWVLSTNLYKINNEELEHLGTKLNIQKLLLFNMKDHNETSIWLYDYQFEVNLVFNKTLKINNKGFEINIENLSNGYKDFLNPVTYTGPSTLYSINEKKLTEIICELANEKLEIALLKLESKINFHGYDLKTVLNNNKLPQTKLEIDNYRNGKNFSRWLQQEADIKFYYWEINIKLTLISIILLLLITLLGIIFYIRYRKIYQPLILKELNLNKEQKQYLKQNKTIINIYRFIKLNSKTKWSYFRKKYNIEEFLLIKEIFKNNIYRINFNKYDNIFYHNKNETSLLGKQFINIFLNCKDFNEYKKNIIFKYPNYFSKKLHKTILYDVLFFNINKIKHSAILISEINFDATTKISLAKIRTFLENHEWNYYSYDLQNLMHLTLIKFLNWKDKGLNFNAYGKVLKRKLLWILQSQEKVDYYLQIIQTINYYRNLLSKASPSRYIKLEEWNQLKDKEKEDLMWQLYFSLVEFMNFTENHLNE